MDTAGGRVMHEHLVNKRLIAYAAMPGLSVRPFQRFRIEPDLNGFILIKALRRPSAGKSFNSQFRFNSLPGHLHLFACDSMRLFKGEFFYSVHIASFHDDWLFLH